MGEYTLSLEGLSGAAFWLVLISLVFYIVGLATVGWAVDGEDDYHLGLWDSCKCNWGTPSACEYSD